MLMKQCVDIFWLKFQGTALSMRCLECTIVEFTTSYCILLLSSIGGIRLRERTVPLKYTVDDDLNLSDDDDDDDVPFPTTRQVTVEWLPEVRRTFSKIFSRRQDQCLHTMRRILEALLESIVIVNTLFIGG